MKCLWCDQEMGEAYFHMCPALDRKCTRCKKSTPAFFLLSDEDKFCEECYETYLLFKEGGERCHH